MIADTNNRIHLIADPHRTVFPHRYQERALGVLQAMVEMNIQPNSSTVSMDTFVSYWDSEAPRIGDAHPSQAGLSQWEKTSSTGSGKTSGSALQTGQDQTVSLV